MKKWLARILIPIVLFIAIFAVVFFRKYPTKYKDIVFEMSNKYNVSASMIASVINIESNYRKDVVSKSGAVGLMQVMPSTAFEIAKKLDLDLNYEQLFEVEINIELGTYYLNYLLSLFDNNFVNALCAYNWGLNNVKTWIIKGNVDSDGNITNVPIKETSDYINKYKKSFWVYFNIHNYNWQL